MTELPSRKKTKVKRPYLVPLIVLALSFNCILAVSATNSGCATAPIAESPAGKETNAALARADEIQIRAAQGQAIAAADLKKSIEDLRAARVALEQESMKRAEKDAQTNARIDSATGTATGIIGAAQPLAAGTPYGPLLLGLGGLVTAGGTLLKQILQHKGNVRDIDDLYAKLDAAIASLGGVAVTASAAAARTGVQPTIVNTGPPTQSGAVPLPSAPFPQPGFAPGSRAA